MDHMNKNIFFVCILGLGMGHCDQSNDTSGNTNVEQHAYEYATGQENYIFEYADTGLKSDAQDSNGEAHENFGEEPLTEQCCGVDEQPGLEENSQIETEALAENSQTEETSNKHIFCSRYAELCPTSADSPYEYCVGAVEQYGGGTVNDAGVACMNDATECETGSHTAVECFFVLM